MQYLNFFIPILKNAKSESNLTLIPFDRLRNKYPEIANRLYGQGATRFEFDGTKTSIYSDNDDSLLSTLATPMADVPLAGSDADDGAGLVPGSDDDVVANGAWPVHFESRLRFRKIVDAAERFSVREPSVYRPGW